MAEVAVEHAGTFGGNPWQLKGISPCRPVRDPGFLSGPGSSLSRLPGSAELTHPIIGAAFPHRWHRKGMFPRSVFRVVPFRPSTSGHGTSAIRLHPGQVARRCE